MAPSSSGRKSMRKPRFAIESTATKSCCNILFWCANTEAASSITVPVRAGPWTDIMGPSNLPPRAEAATAAMIYAPAIIPTVTSIR